jgi:hypothetical protein
MSDHAAPLQSACCSCVRLRARHSFVPAKSRSAAARSNGRGQAGALLRALLQRPKARHITGDRALQDNPALQGRPVVLLQWRCIVLVGIARHHVRDAVDATIVKGGAPAFLISRKSDFHSAVIASDMLRSDRDRPLSAPRMRSDDRECGRSSALFPAMPLQADAASADPPNHDRSAEATRSLGRVHGSSTMPNPRGERLFPARSSERRPR